MYFVSLNLADLPDSPLRRRVLDITTSFYLPAQDVNSLKEAGRVLLSRSQEYRRLMQDLALPAPAEAPLPNEGKAQEAASAALPEPSASDAQAQ